ncbi:MAG: Gx transporter family protein [Clostridia bacterium]|nr:Gx transporter family protein [Clostridia bacterium]
MQSRVSPARRVALSAVLCALSLLFSYLESFIPMPIPGMKIGLANLIPLLLLPSLGAPTAACVSLLRIGLSALLFGSPVSFLYSLAGGVVSFAVMALVFRLRFFGLTGVSVLGGVSHNLGQIVVAILALGTRRVLVLTPWLILAGAVAGLAVGLLGAYLLPRLKNVLPQGEGARCCDQANEKEGSASSVSDESEG